MCPLFLVIVLPKYQLILTFLYIFNSYFLTFHKHSVLILYQFSLFFDFLRNNDGEIQDGRSNDVITNKNWHHLVEEAQASPVSVDFGKPIGWRLIVFRFSITPRCEYDQQINMDPVFCYYLQGTLPLRGAYLLQVIFDVRTDNLKTRSFCVYGHVAECYIFNPSQYSALRFSNIMSSC